MNENEDDILDTNDFLDQYGLSQCEADELAISLKKNNKEKIFKILLDNKVSPEKCENYYQIMRKDFTKKFSIVEDNTYLKDDKAFKQLEDLNFMFSTGTYIEKGFLSDDMIISAKATRYQRKEIKQIWIVKEIK